MEITVQRQPKAQKFEDFIERKNLQIQVVQRCQKDYCFGDFKNARFYAMIKYADIAENGMLAGSFENGSTVEDAVAKLPRLYSGRRIKIANSYYIQCPEFL